MEPHGEFVRCFGVEAGAFAAEQTRRWTRFWSSAALVFASSRLLILQVGHDLVTNFIERAGMRGGLFNGERRAAIGGRVVELAFSGERFDRGCP
jgi:hypothetical protein